MPQTSKWPKNVAFVGYSADRDTLFKSKDRLLDIHDNFLCTLFQNLDFPFFLAARVDDPKWELLGDSDDGVWDEARLDWFESMIIDDFGFDGVEVCVTRQFEEGWPCSTTALWRIDRRSV